MSTAPTVSLSEQIEEVAREIRQRERLYPKWIDAGRLKPETAAKKLLDLRAAHASLLVLFENLDWIRPALAERLAARRLMAEAETLKDHEAVKPVLDEFEGATIDKVRELDNSEHGSVHA